MGARCPIHDLFWQGRGRMDLEIKIERLTYFLVLQKVIEMLVYMLYISGPKEENAFNLLYSRNCIPAKVPRTIEQLQETPFKKYLH